MHPLLTTLRSLLAFADETGKKANDPGKGNGKRTEPGAGAVDKADTTTTSDVTPSDDGGLLGALGGLITSHWWVGPVLFLAASIGINYLWKQYRNKQSMRGVAVRPLGPIIGDLGKFARVEDKRPLHPKLPPKVTASRVYGVLALLIVLSCVPRLPTLPFGPLIPFMLLALVLGSRYSKIARARRNILNQMFAVATSECRYPKGSELAPWNYVQIGNWTNLVQPGQTVIQIPAAYQSEDQKTREKFERNFNGTVSEENAWTYKWESAKNRLICEPAALLPGMAAYPGPGEKWDEIPVGVRGDGTQAIIPLSVTPHSLVCGPTGSGKSVLQRSVLFHILAHSDTWRLVAIDMKRVEMAWLRKYPQVLKVATDLEEAVEVLRSLKAEMMRRYEEMEEAGVNHAKDLPNPPKAIFCMIDESTVLLAPEGIKTDEGKERDELHGEAGAIMGELGRLSRASMIHVMACFQRPDATFLKGETKANFDCRIAAGRMDTTPSLMVLDSEAANRLPKIKGRGMIRIGGELDTFQGYFAEQSWFDEWVAKQEGGSAPSVEGGDEEDETDSYADVTTDADDAKMPPLPAPASVGAGEPEGGKRPRGFRGLAAKAAAKAQERAARMDAEAGLDVSADGWVGGPDVDPEEYVPVASQVAPVLAPTPVPAAALGTAPVAVPTHLPTPTPAAPAAPSAQVPPQRLPATPHSSFTGDGVEDEDLTAGFDFDSLLVDVDAFDDFDEEFDDMDDPEGAVEESPPASPVARPVVPQPVTAPVQAFQPGGALPSSMPAPPPVQPPVQAPVQAPAPPVLPARPPVGLPVRPPVALPVQPPQPPATR